MPARYVYLKCSFTRVHTHLETNGKSEAQREKVIGQREEQMTGLKLDCRLPVGD